MRVNDVAADLIRQALALLELKPCDEDPKVQAALDSIAKRVAGLGAILAGHAQRASWASCSTCGGNGRIGDDLVCWECQGIGYLPPKAIPPITSTAPSTPASTQTGDTPPEPPAPGLDDSRGG